MLLAFSSVGLSQTPITVTDGTHTCPNCRKIVFTSITVSGTTATVVGGGGGGSGDVVGPASATDNAVARFNLTTGKLLQNSVVLIGDTGNITGLGTLNTHTIPGGTSTFTLQSDNLSVFASTTSAQLRGVLSDESGTGVAYFQGGNLGTPSAGVGTNFTGIPISTGLTGAGTGVLTALGVNIGSAGAPVLFNGAGGTPSSLTLTNGTGLPLSTGVTGDLPFANFVQAGSAGFVGATGAGDYSHRTPTQVTAALDAFVGDSGSGGTKGLVPAPASGDAAAGKFLKADGTFAVPSGGGGGTPGGSTTQLQYNNAGAFGGISTLTSDGTIVTFSPTVTTGTGATSGLDATANSLTTGDAFTFSSSSVTTGNLVKLASTSTAAGSNTQTVLNVATSGANGTSTQTTYGARVSNTHTGTGSTNVGLQVTASGGATNNYALMVGDSSNALETIASNLSGSSDPAIIMADANVLFRPSGTSGAATLYVGTTAVSFSSSVIFGWGNGSNANGGTDVALRRSAAADLAFGAADAASPVAQTLSVQNVVAGTSNTAGANWTLAGSRGTGTGAGGSIIFQTAPAGSTGSTQNSLVTAVTIGPSGALFPKAFTFSALPTISDGGMVYCSDCAPTSAFVDQTCAGSGTGAMAYRLNGAWKCYN